MFFSAILATWSLPLEDDNSIESSPNIEASAKVRQQRYYDNHYDGRLFKVCPSGNPFSRVISRHNNHREDRIWRWECGKTFSSTSHQQCRWHKNVNGYDQPMFFKCGGNKYLSGVYSHHNNRREDRVWSFKCCGSLHYAIKNCYGTGYVNDWDKYMHYTVPSGKVITGVYSYHNNHRE